MSKKILEENIEETFEKKKIQGTWKTSE